MMKIISYIDECEDGHDKTRNIISIKGIAIHRISPDLGEDATSITKSFTDTSTRYSAGSYTGGKMPYTFIIQRGEEGEIQQAKPLYDVSPHARKFNHSYIGIAAIGDFTSHPPTERQWSQLVWLCGKIMFGIGKSIELKGHSDLKGSSSDPKKICPGKYLPMDRLRIEVGNQVNLFKVSCMISSGISL